jgi:hypothetical protein
MSFRIEGVDTRREGAHPSRPQYLGIRHRHEFLVSHEFQTPCEHGTSTSKNVMRPSVYQCRKGTSSFGFNWEEGLQIGSSSA